MYSTYVILFIATFCSLAFSEETFLPVSKVSKTTRTASTSLRQAASKKKKLCSQFFLTYGKVQQATNFLVNHIKPAEAQYKKCKACLFCRNCDKSRDSAFVKSAQACIKVYSFSACVMAVALIERLDKVSLSCHLYFKNSRVGNCYAQEYLTLNGYKGKNKALVFYREVGIYEKKFFQCRAGNRASVGTPKNAHSCRQKFNVSPKQINDVALCAFPRFSMASTELASCLSRSLSIWDTYSCHIKYRYQANIAYINCIIPHGVPAVAVASLSIGMNAINCPVLRRDSYVGRCKAPDFVQLKQMDLIELKGNYLKVLVLGACKY